MSRQAIHFGELTGGQMPSGQSYQYSGALEALADQDRRRIYLDGQGEYT